MIRSCTSVILAPMARGAWRRQAQLHPSPTPQNWTECWRLDVWKGEESVCLPPDAETESRTSPGLGWSFSSVLPSSLSILGPSAPLTRRTSPFTPGPDTDPPPLHPPLPRRQQQTWDSLPSVPLRRHQHDRQRRGRRHVPAAPSLSDA